MNKSAKIIIGIITIIVIAIAIWQGTDKNQVTGNIVKTEKQTIRIGAVLPLTGQGSALGEAVKEGIEWKIEELRNQGYEIKFYIEDSQSDPKQAVSAFNKLINIHKIKIVFTMLSSHAMVLKPIAEKNKILLWGYSGHPEITKDSTYLLRHSNTVDEDAKTMSRYILQEDFKKVSIIYQQDEWGNVWNEILPPILKEENIQIISESIDPKDSDFKTTILKIKNKNPDAIVLSVYGPTIGILIKQIKELEYEGVIYTSPGFITTPGAQEIAGDYARGIYYQTFKENSMFEQDYRMRFDEEPVFWVLIPYTDLELLEEALKQTQSTKPEKIIEFIKNLNEFQGKYEKALIKPSGDIIFETIIKKWE